MLDDLKYQRLNRNTLVRVDEDGSWHRLEDDPDLSFLIRIQDSYAYTGHNEVHPEKAHQPKSATVVIIALVVALLMGAGIAFFLFLAPR